MCTQSVYLFNSTYDVILIVEFKQFFLFGLRKKVLGEEREMGAVCIILFLL